MSASVDHCLESFIMAQNYNTQKSPLKFFYFVCFRRWARPFAGVAARRLLETLSNFRKKIRNSIFYFRFMWRRAMRTDCTRIDFVKTRYFKHLKFDGDTCATTSKGFFKLKQIHKSNRHLCDSSLERGPFYTMAEHVCGISHFFFLHKFLKKHI